MLIVSHRGNLTGPNSANENYPAAIDVALNLGFDVEIDLRQIDGKFYLGHDNPDHEISFGWLVDRRHGLWIHCKNAEALVGVNIFPHIFNSFWHQEDDYALTSQEYIMVKPGCKIPSQRGIAMMPEWFPDWDITDALAVCTDFPERFRNEL